MNSPTALTILHYEGEPTMENMEYYTQRLQCSDEEKVDCLETVAKLYRLRWHLRENGALAAGVLAEEEADPFCRACLMEIGDVFLHPEELERRYTRYLMAGDYRGADFRGAGAAGPVRRRNGCAGRDFLQQRLGRTAWRNLAGLFWSGAYRTGNGGHPEGRTGQRGPKGVQFPASGIR